MGINSPYYCFVSFRRMWNKSQYLNREVGKYCKLKFKDCSRNLEYSHSKNYIIIGDKLMRIHMGTV